MYNLLLAMEIFIITIFRIIVPLSIFRWPLAGFLLSITFDTIDWFFLPHISPSEMEFYNKWDKFFDMYFVTIALMTLLEWKDKMVRNVGVWLYAYRILGVALFELTGLRFLMFIFPNIFDLYFLLVNVHKKFFNREKIFATAHNCLITLVLLTMIKLVQEYIIHISQKMPWEYIVVPFLGQAGNTYGVGNVLFWCTVFTAALTGVFMAKIYLDRTDSGNSAIT